MKSKAVLLMLWALCLLLLLSGCRTRTGGSDQGRILPDAAEGVTDDARQGESASQDSADAAALEGDEDIDTGDGGEPGSQTRENPDAPRKEYDESAPAEIIPGTDRLLHGEGDGDGLSAANEEAAQSASQLNERAEETAVQTIEAQEAEQMGVSDDAEAADSAMTYFTVLLQDRMGSLFECQRLNVYWETAQDHVTIHKTSLEHTMILNAGLYDVSARLLPENLLVDDGWVARKNPGVIVKLVDGSVLGGGVDSTSAARAVEEGLRSREGWAAIDAVKNNRVLLLSEELLEAPHLQTAAMVMIARTASPALLSDVDLDEALQMLMEEAAGTFPTGIYYYRKEERA